MGLPISYVEYASTEYCHVICILWTPTPGGFHRIAVIQDLWSKAVVGEITGHPSRTRAVLLGGVLGGIGRGRLGIHLLELFDLRSAGRWRASIEFLKGGLSCSGRR